MIENQKTRYVVLCDDSRGCVIALPGGEQAMTVMTHAGFIENQKARYAVLRDDSGGCVISLPGGKQKRSDPAALRLAGWRFVPVSTDSPSEAQFNKGWWHGNSEI